MARGLFKTLVVDAAGTIVPSVNYEVLDEATGALAAVYDDIILGTQMPNPWLTQSDGYISLYLEEGLYRIRVWTDLFTREWRHVMIGDQPLIDAKDTLLAQATTRIEQLSDTIDPHAAQDVIEALGRIRARVGAQLQDAISAPAAIAGRAILYVDAADGALKVKFGNGTVRVIAGDVPHFDLAPGRLLSAQRIDAVLLNPAAPSGQKKWNPGWGVLLDGYMEQTVKQDAWLNLSNGHIIETASMPTVTYIKGMVRWGGLEKGTNGGDYSDGMFLIERFLDACAAAGKMLMLSPHPIAFGGGNFHDGSIFPTYISENPTTYGITEPLSYGSGAMARTWRPAVTDRLCQLVEAIGAEFNDHPNFGCIQTEETSINVANGVDGFSYSAYTQQLKIQIERAAAAFPDCLIRTSTNYADSDARMQEIIAHCALHKVGCGGPDTLPKEAIQANRIFNGYTGGVDYRGSNLWVGEIQLPEMGSGKEGDFSMQQLYDTATAGIAYAHQVGGGGPVITLNGITGRPQRPSIIVVTRNMTAATPPATFRLMWTTDLKPFMNSHVGYGPGGDTYPSGW